MPTHSISQREKLMRSTGRMLAIGAVAALLAAGTSLADETFKTQLPENGLTVILKEDHSAPVVNLRCYVKAGSITEREYLEAGLSHYLEHTVGTGTTNRTAEQIRAEIEAIGGASNAYTTKDHTCYFVETSSRYFDEALDLLADKMINATLPPEHCEIQKGVIIREINMGYDEPNRRIYNLFGQVMFRQHPARHPVIGYVEVFEQMDRDDLVAYHDRMYVPNNMIFVAVGDFDVDDAHAKIHEAFKDFERAALDVPALPEEPPQLGKRVLREERDLNVAYVLMGYHTVPVSDPDLYPLDILSFILSEGNSSRLYRKLVDELGLVHSIDTWSHTPGYDAGVFAISMTLDPANIDAAISAVTEELYKLRKDRVKKGELSKAKKLKETAFYFGRQELGDLASSLGISELTTGNPDFDEVYVENLQNVTADEIREIVNRYFYDDNLGIAILEPKRDGTSKPPEASEDIVQIGRVQKRVLDNGLTVLIKENHALPIVAIGTYTLAGLRFEDRDVNGVSSFLAGMLTRGTNKASAGKIAEKLDSMGASLSCEANHTRLECELLVLESDLEDGLELISDILTNPKLDEREIEKQRELVLAEIRSRSDNWTYDAMDRMLSSLYTAHPYGLPPKGTEATVSAVTHDDLERFNGTYVVPGSTVLTIFGDLDPQVAMEKAEKAFSRWKRADVQPPPAAHEPDLRESVTTESYHDRAQTVVFRGYRGVPYSSEDRYALHVLDGVISGINYPGGWLHEHLRGNQLVYVVHAYNWTGYDSGYFGLYAATSDERLAEAIEIIDSDLASAVHEQVSDDELELAKQLCIVMNELNRQRNTDQARDAAVGELYGLGYDHNEGYAERINAVTKDDVQRVAKKYLTNSVTVIRRPQSEEVVPR